MQSRFQPAVGVDVAGYRLERRLGEGGMSEVWAATDTANQRTVALKMLLPKAQTNPEIVARFRREAELLRRIDSAHVPRFYDFVDQSIIVEEYVEGELLAQVFDRKRFTLEEAIELGIGLARALIEVHRAGIVHRDLKPGNVILRPEPDGGHRAVLIDLGVSRLTLHAGQEDTEALTEITHVERAVGTIAYMAPEQFIASSKVSETVDLYALGAILFRAVAGHHVFGDLQGIDVARVKLVDDAPLLVTARDGEVARAFERLVARTLHREPHERYRSADELLADLLLLGQGVAPKCEPPTAPSLVRSIVLDPESLSLVFDAPPTARRWPGAATTLALIGGLAVGALVQRQWQTPVAHADEHVACPVACALPPPALEAAPQACLAPPLATAVEHARAIPARTTRGKAKIVQVVDRETPRPVSLLP